MIFFLSRHIHCIYNIPFCPQYFHNFSCKPHFCSFVIITLCPQFINITENRVHMLESCLIFELFQIFGAVIVYYISFEQTNFKEKWMKLCKTIYTILVCIMSGICQITDLKFAEMILVFISHFPITQNRIPNKKCTAFFPFFCAYHFLNTEGT